MNGISKNEQISGKLFKITTLSFLQTECLVSRANFKKWKLRPVMCLGCQDQILSFLRSQMICSRISIVLGSWQTEMMLKSWSWLLLVMWSWLVDQLHWDHDCILHYHERFFIWWWSMKDGFEDYESEYSLLVKIVLRIVVKRI